MGTQIAMSASDWLSLDVGGRKISTTRSTLTSCPDSVLARMFGKSSNLQPARKVDGSYTLDIDPNCFEVILNWLRHRQLMIPSTITLDSVIVVAEFYGLYDMVEQLKQAQAPPVLTGESFVLEVKLQSHTGPPDWTWEHGRRWISTQVSGLCVLARHDPQLMRKILQKIHILGQFVSWHSIMEDDVRHETIDSVMHMFSDQDHGAHDLFIEHPGECGTHEVVKVFMDVGGFSVKKLSSSSGVWTLSR